MLYGSCVSYSICIKSSPFLPSPAPATEHAENAETSNGCGCATRIGYVKRKTAFNTNCVKLLRFVCLEQMGGSLKRSLGMAFRSLCKAQHLITIGIIRNRKTIDETSSATDRQKKRNLLYLDELSQNFLKRFGMQGIPCVGRRTINQLLSLLRCRLSLRSDPEGLF
jgi:hypothetical protein